jgi:hypothetical protein
VEKNLLCRKIIQQIIYSKESIRIKLFARAEGWGEEKENPCLGGNRDGSNKEGWLPGLVGA